MLCLRFAVYTPARSFVNTFAVCGVRVQQAKEAVAADSAQQVGALLSHRGYSGYRRDPLLSRLPCARVLSQVPDVKAFCLRAECLFLGRVCVSVCVVARVGEGQRSECTRAPCASIPVLVWS